MVGLNANSQEESSVARGANKPYEMSSDLCLLLLDCVKCRRSCVVQYFPDSPRFVTQVRLKIGCFE